MAEHLLTRCPHCSTTFRLTQAQLDIADGAVRCGACYQVFHAAEHTVKTSVVEEHRKVEQEPDPVEEAFEIETTDGLDPYDTSDIEAIESDTDDFFDQELEASLDHDTSLEDFGYEDAKPTSQSKHDEGWAEELLKELGEDDDDELLINDKEEKDPVIISGDNAFSLEEPDADTRPRERKSAELSETFLNLGNFSSDDPFAISDIEEEEFNLPEEGGVDESWAKAMLSELEDEDRPQPPKTPNELSILSDDEDEPADDGPFAAKELSKDRREIIERAKQEKQKQKELNKQSLVVKPLEQDESDVFYQAPEWDEQYESGYEEVDELVNLDSSLADKELETITPENLFSESDDLVEQQIHLSELEYDDQGASEANRSKLVWGLGSLLLLGILAIQYIYFNFESLALNPNTRPWAEKTCGVLGCTLPPQTDVSQIVGTNLVVRSHPYEKNALVIDVIIKNRANFVQPYPQVQLSFEDPQGNPLASRRFAPREYIKDKSINLNRMPINVPVHLTLEIVDPGKDAVNYQLHFLPHDETS